MSSRPSTEAIAMQRPKKKRLASLAFLALLPSACVVVFTLPVSSCEWSVEDESLRTVLRRVAALADEVRTLDVAAPADKLRALASDAALLDTRLSRALAVAGQDEEILYSEVQSRLSSLAGIVAPEGDPRDWGRMMIAQAELLAGALVAAASR